jgi:hypothetical protein
MFPQILGLGACPFSVIKSKFLGVLLRGESSEEKMLQYRVMQDDDAGMLESAIVNCAVQLIVADVVKGNVRFVSVNFYVTMLAKSLEQSFSVIRDTGFGGRARREEANCHSLLFLAGTEQSGADADVRGALFDRRFEVVRHAHR